MTTTAQYVPSIREGVAVAGWDTADNRWHALNLDYIRQPQVLPESLHILEILDTRLTVTATIAAASAVGTTATATITVPTGEVWFINCIRMTSPAESGAGVGDIVQVNFAVDVWPLTGQARGQDFYAANQGTVAADVYDTDFHGGAPFMAVTNKSVALRLEAGDIITLYAILTGAAAGAALAATLTPFGYKGKKIISRV